ncbi:Ima1 N-terminal domain-containing protein [Fomitopsis serialis]|uniref:Ima1 N-terminal domain-containing protein n=1 Tax=Fomitopsis serialis TaxID=139415 RepID=UPI0020071F94|nr:Ima1 N-terminal domain-containing protein [Neoantrodia serialis]KAH9937043.1 Ima1 N-terminal domain-containing protein [Neoantrodia serialis]
MSKIFKQHSSVICFFCQSIISPIPRNPRSFRCPHCDCWNRFDPNGEIISDEPAMHDENLNTQSFARRASPRKDRLPSMYGSAPFCRTCQTNQMLLSNLLSNYLPPPDHPDHDQRAAMLPEYRRSIETRYPPVCTDCAPAVEEEIRRRDNMARTRALGGFLGSSNPPRRPVARTQRDRDRFTRQITFWKIRDVYGCYASVALGYARFHVPDSVKQGLPALALLSIFWTAWDPTYGSLKRAEFQGRMVRQRGKREYNVYPAMIVWLSRCGTSLLLAMSWFKPEWGELQRWTDPESPLRSKYCTVSLVLESVVKRPPPVRLTEAASQGKQSLVSTASGPHREPLFQTRCCPIVRAPNPVFGMPSFRNSPDSGSNHDAWQDPAMDMDDDDDDDVDSRRRDPNAMDWSPTIPSPQKRRPHGQARTHDDGSWLRPQRLFSTTIKLSDDDQAAADARSGTRDKRGNIAQWLNPVKLWRR